MKNLVGIAALAIVLASNVAAFGQSADTASINANAGVLTMVNVLTPKPGKQEEAIALLQAGMAQEMSKQPGFISSTIHRSLNSDHVVVYAQWENRASVDAAVTVIQSGDAPNMANVFSIASPDFHPYEVKSIHLSDTE